MARKYDANFASAVTSMAFTLSLSRGMIFRMVAIKNGQHMADLWRMAGVPDNAVPSGWALQKRGLVWSPDADNPGIYKLTEAGELVYSLLEIAGLVQASERQLEKVAA